MICYICLYIYLHQQVSHFSYGIVLCFYKHSHFYKTWEQTKLKKKEPPTNVGDNRNVGSIPRLERSPGGGHGNPLQDSCLENPMDRGAWQAIVHGVAKSQIQPRWLTQYMLRRILKWVAVPSSRGSFRPRDGTCVPYIPCIGRRVLYH